jgi:hypothetical protein
MAEPHGRRRFVFFLADLWFGALLVLEAASLSDAVALAKQHPALAFGTDRGSTREVLRVRRRQVIPPFVSS